MFTRFLRAMAPWLLLGMVSMLACDLSTIGLSTPTKPQVTIQVPAANAEFREGDEVAVQSTATDAKGIVRVELAVDGASVQTSVPPIPQGQTAFTVIQRWQASAGSHTISVRAYNESGLASEPVLVTVNVVASVRPSPVAQATLPLVSPIGGTPSVVTPPLGTVPTVPPSQPTAANATPTRTRTPAPRATNTISAPPGMYALSIRPDSADPKRNTPIGFYVTFLNTTGTVQQYQWRVRIFEPEKRNSFGDTAIKRDDIPVGTTELQSVVNWKIGGPGDCLTFTARVFWIDPGTNGEVEFLKPDGSGGPATGFKVCP
jgi:hypothetical protein